MNPELKPLLDNVVAPLAVMAVVWLITQIYDRMPQVLAPLLAAALGPAAAGLSAVATSGEMSWWAAATAGFLATGIHQWLKKGGRTVQAVARGEQLPTVGRSGRAT